MNWIYDFVGAKNDIMRVAHTIRLTYVVFNFNKNVR